MNFDATVAARYGIPTSLVNAKGHRVVVSDAFADLIRRPKDELIGGNWETIAHPLDLAANSARIRAVFESGEPCSSRWRLRRGDGSWLHSTIRGIGFRDHSHGPLFVQGNILVDAEDRALGQAPDARRLTDEATVAEYIKDLTAELARIAGHKRMRLLEHLLTMASAEAAIEIEKRVPGVAVDLQRLRTLN